MHVDWQHDVYKTRCFTCVGHRLRIMLLEWASAHSDAAPVLLKWRA